MKKNPIDNFLMAVSPSLALRRARNRHMAQAYYSDRGTSDKRTPRNMLSGRNATPDGRTARSAIWVRSKARELEETYDLAESTIGTFVRALVGPQVIFEPQVLRTDGTVHEEFNKLLRQYYKLWARRPEVTWEYDYHEGARQHVRSWLRDGEIFQQYLTGMVPALTHGSDIPLSLEHIEADFIPVEYSNPSKRIVQSVEKNAWGRSLAFWQYKTTPGELTAGTRRYGTPDKRIPADRMIHQKHTTHFRQTRGMSILAPVLTRIDDIQEIEESERIAARCAAAMVGFRKRGNAEAWEDYDDDEEKGAELAFEPGTFHDLEPGEDVSIHQSQRPNNALIPFMTEQMRRMAGGTGANASSVSKDYSGSYSSQRQEMTEGYIGYGVMHADLVNAKLFPDWKMLVDTLVRFRLLDVPLDVDVNTIHDVDIPRPPMPWIDPKKEADGYKVLVDAELESATHVMRMRGRDPSVVKNQIESDKLWRSAQKQEPKTQPEIKSDDEEKDDD